MSSALCCVCKQTVGQTICVGCSNAFCFQDFCKHRDQLFRVVEQEITANYNDLMSQFKNSGMLDKICAPLSAKIDAWVNTMIEKIHQTADKVRLEIKKWHEQEEHKWRADLKSLNEQISSCIKKQEATEQDIQQLQQRMTNLRSTLEDRSRMNLDVVTNDVKDWNHLIYTIGVQQCAKTLDVPEGTTWIANALTVVGGNNPGTALNQFLSPHSFVLDDDGSILVVDSDNNRIVKWKRNGTIGEVVIDRNGTRSRKDQLNQPIDVIIDRETDSLIISDRGNRRVLRWPRHGGKAAEIIVDNVECCGLAMDSQRFLYVTDTEKNEVRRYKIDDTKVNEIVAGGHGRGVRLNQLDFPTFVFVGNDQCIYVSDTRNHRVMKWLKGEKEGSLVAGTKSRGNGFNQLSSPRGLFVDRSETVYIVDSDNHRIMRWKRDASKGDIIAGGNGEGERSNQFNTPVTLTFDRDCNLYVMDLRNARIQRFSTAQIN